MTTTTAFFEAIRKVSQGDEAIARIIADYVEETKQTNIASLKDVFMTKDDKADLIKQLKDDKADLLKHFDTTQWRTVAFITTFFTILLGVCTAVLHFFK